LAFAIKINIFGLGLMALWNTVNTIILPVRVDDVSPANLQGSAVGLVSLIGVGIAALVQPIAGRLSDASPLSDRRRPFVVAGALLAVPCLVLFGWAPDFWLLLLGYVLLQIAVNIAQAAFQAFIPDLIPEPQRGTASGVKNALTVVGAALGLIGARALIALNAGYGVVLVYLALILVATAGLTAVWVPEIPPLATDGNGHSWSAAFDIAALWRSFERTLREHVTFRYAVIAQFLFLLGTYPAQRFLLLFLRDRFGAGAEERASVGLAVAIVLAAVAAAGSGSLSDAVGRLPVLMASVLLAAIGMAGIGFAPTIVIASVAGGLVAVGVGAFQAVNWALLSDDISEGQGAGSFGVANIATAGAGALAGLFGPLVDVLLAVLPGGAFQITFGVAGLVALGSIWPLFRIKHGRPPGATNKP